jgi:hypothetical protein
VCRTEARQEVTKNEKEEGENTKEAQSAARQVASDPQLRVLAFCFVFFVTSCLLFFWVFRWTEYFFSKKEDSSCHSPELSWVFMWPAPMLWESAPRHLASPPFPRVKTPPLFGLLPRKVWRRSMPFRLELCDSSSELLQHLPAIGAFALQAGNIPWN